MRYPSCADLICCDDIIIFVDRPLQSLQSRLQSSFLGFRKLPPNVNKMCSNANFTTAQRQEGARIISLLSRGETEAQKKVA